MYLMITKRLILITKNLLRNTAFAMSKGFRAWSQTALDKWTLTLTLKICDVTVTLKYLVKVNETTEKRYDCELVKLNKESTTIKLSLTFWRNFEESQMLVYRLSIPTWDGAGSTFQADIVKSNIPKWSIPSGCFKDNLQVKAYFNRLAYIS